MIQHIIRLVNFLADGLSLEFEWQATPQDSSQEFCSLDGLGSSSDFQFFQHLYQTFRDCSKRTVYN